MRSDKDVLITVIKKQITVIKNRDPFKTVNGLIAVILKEWSNFLLILEIRYNP